MRILLFMLSHIIFRNLANIYNSFLMVINIFNQSYMLIYFVSNKDIKTIIIDGSR